MALARPTITGSRHLGDTGRRELLVHVHASLHSVYSYTPGVWLRAVATADADAGARELAAVCHELWRRQPQRFERGGAVPALATIGGGHGGLRLG